MKSGFDFLWRNSLKECSGNDRRTIRAVLGAAFFSTFGVGAYTFALSLTAESSGFSPSWLGLAFSGYFLARLVLAPFAGYCADFIGTNPMLLVASGLGSIVSALYCFSTSNEILGVIQICLGFCAGIIKPVSMALLGQCVPKGKHGRFFGAYNICLYSAFVFGPLVGGAGVSFFGGIGPFIVFLPGAGMGISFLLFFLSRMSPLARKQKNKQRREGPPWGNPVFVALLAAVFGRTLGASVIVTFLPRLINERFGLSAVLAGLIFVLPNIVIILGMPLTSTFADIRDKTGLTFLGMGLCAACVFGLGQPVSALFFACLTIFMGFGSALSLPASMSLAAEMGPAKGSVMGIFLGVSNLGFVLGPGLAGFAAEYGGMADSFELTALVGGLCLLPIFLLMSKNLYVK